MIRLLPISLSLIVLISGCSLIGKSKLSSKKVVRNDIEMLYGPVSKEQLYFDFPKWKQIEDEYQPDTGFINKLSAINTNIDVKIFLATWCSDSRREVPHFFKILADARLLKKVNVTMWGVDRKLDVGPGLKAKFDIQKVATFIFYRNDREIGRIIESPEAFLLEEDILNIIK